MTLLLGALTIGCILGLLALGVYVEWKTKRELSKAQAA